MQHTDELGKQPQISIIMPVYNAAKTLRKSLLALKEQTFADIEILCVDDGSTDDSLKILQEFSSQDKRFRVFTQSNRGPGAARNVGLAHAKGEYLMFCDADDWYEPTMCEAMHRTIRENRVDLAMCNSFVPLQQNSGRSQKDAERYVPQWTGTRYLNTDVKLLTNLVLWNKIFRMDLIRKYDVSFPEESMSEDDSFCCQYLAVSRWAAALDTQLYNHVLHKDSLMGRFLNGGAKKNPLAHALTMRYTIGKLRANGVLIINADFLLIRMERNLRYIWPKLGFLNRLRAVRLYRELVFLLPRRPSQKAKMLFYACLNPFVWAVLKVFFMRHKSREIKGKINSFWGRIEELTERLESAHRHWVETTRPPADRRLFVLWDCLYDLGTEAIDAFSLFKQLKARNVPCVYIVLKGNGLYHQLKLDRFPQPDIFVVEDQEELFEKHQDLLVQATHILSSFGLLKARNVCLHDLSYLDYIFIGHGVTLIKERVTDVYSPDKFNKILVPTPHTEKLQLRLGNWRPRDMICADLPRWSFLESEPHKEKTIFIFFTWRRSFSTPKGERDFAIYAKRISAFLKDPAFISWCQKYHIQVKMALHHATKYYGKELSLPAHVTEIPTDQISKAVRQCDLLITDYSSLFVDFARQNKPVLFYLFDRDVCYGDLESQDMVRSAGIILKQLYNICYSREEILSKLEHYRKRDFELEATNKEINRNFFWCPARPLVDVYAPFAPEPSHAAHINTEVKSQCR